MTVLIDSLGHPVSGATAAASDHPTPVLDDVTLFFDDGGPRILGWVCP